MGSSYCAIEGITTYGISYSALPNSIFVEIPRDLTGLAMHLRCTI